MNISRVKFLIKSIVLAMLFVLIIWFMLPFGVGIYNVGNIFGILACVVGILLVLLYKPVLKKPVKKALKVIYIIVYCFYGCCILFALFLSANMLYHALNYPEKPACVVVLGCQVNGENPSLMLQRRLDVAYDYLGKNPDAKCIVTGGQGKNEIISEGEVMANYLIEKGIDPDRIFAETAASDTFENLHFAKEIAQQEGLGDSIAIATDGFHQWRATMIAEDCGFEVHNISAETPTFLLATYWFREWLGVCNYVLFGNGGFNV